MYRNLLLATDLAPDTDIVTDRARALARDGATLSVIHVIEPLALAYGAEMPVDLATLQEELSRQARARLDAMADDLGIPRDRALLANGKIEKEVLRIAKERDIDLIIVGSHSRRGLAVLLGSTANAVLHHAHCDVLSVRIPRH